MTADLQAVLKELAEDAFSREPEMRDEDFEAYAARVREAVLGEQVHMTGELRTRTVALAADVEILRRGLDEQRGLLHLDKQVAKNIVDAVTKVVGDVPTPDVLRLDDATLRGALATLLQVCMLAYLIDPELAPAAREDES